MATAPFDTLRTQDVAAITEFEEGNLEIRKIVLIQPGREGRIFGKAPAASYTLMRLASLVPADIEVELWHHDWEPGENKLRTLGKHDLVGITARSYPRRRWARRTAETRDRLDRRGRYRHWSVGRLWWNRHRAVECN